MDGCCFFCLIVLFCPFLLDSHVWNEYEPPPPDRNFRTHIPKRLKVEWKIYVRIRTSRVLDIAKWFSTLRWDLKQRKRCSVCIVSLYFMKYTVECVCVECSLYTPVHIRECNIHHVEWCCTYKIDIISF